MKCPNPSCTESIDEGELFCAKCGASTPELQQKAIEEAYSGRPEKILDNVRLKFGRNTLVTGTHGMLPLRFINEYNRQPITYLKLTLQCSACEDNHKIQVERQMSLHPGREIRFYDCEFNINCAEGDYTLKIQGELLLGSSRPVAFHASERIYIREKAAGHTGGIKIQVQDGGALDAGGVPVGQDIDIEVKDGGAVDLGGVIATANASETQMDWVDLNLEFAPDKTRLLESFYETRQQAVSENLPSQQSNLDSMALWSFHRPDDVDVLVRIFTGKSFTLGRNPEQVDLVTTFLPATEENIEKSLAISGRQCRIHLAKSGVSISDCNSKNGVRVQGNKVTGRYELTNGCRLLLANAFRFDFREFRELAELKEVSEIRQSARNFTEFSTRIGNLQIDDLRHDAPLDCCLLIRGDDFSERLKYLFVQRFAYIGSSSSCGLYLEHPSVGKQHARLILMEKGYYLEALDSQRETWIGNYRLHPGRPRLLPANVEILLRFGEVLVTFQATVKEQE